MNSRIYLEVETQKSNIKLVKARNISNISKASIQCKSSDTIEVYQIEYIVALKH